MIREPLGNATILRRPFEVIPGDVLLDLDPRREGRRVMVTQLGERHAYVVPLERRRGQRETRLRYETIEERPSGRSGFRLVGHVRLVAGDGGVA